MWDTLSNAERLQFVCRFAGVQTEKIDQNLVYLAEENLNYIQRERYVELVSAEVSVITYRGLSDAQIQSQETAQRYYFNMLHLSTEIKARCLWEAVTQN